MSRIEKLIAQMTLEEKLGQLTMTAGSYAVTGPIIAGDSTESIANGTIGNLLNMVGPGPTHEMQRLAVEAYRAVECEGMARVDFLMETATGKFYVNEINTIPGFTSISMYPKMWEAAGVPFTELLDRLIELALERHRSREATRYKR